MIKNEIQIAHALHFSNYQVIAYKNILMCLVKRTPSGKLGVQHYWEAYNMTVFRIC